MKGKIFAGSRVSTFGLLAVIAVFAGGCNKTVSLKAVPEDKLKEDLDFLFKTVEEIHPNMYAYTSKEEFGKIKEDLYAKIKQPMNTVDFYKATAPVVACLKNGHTRIQPPFQYFQYYAKNGGKYFPLEIQIDKETVTLLDCQSPCVIPKGAEICTIEGTDAFKYMLNLSRYSPSENRPYNLALPQSESVLPFYLWLEKNNSDLMDLEFKTADGRIDQTQLKAVSYEELVNYQKKNLKKSESKVKNENAKYTYKYIEEQNVGWIEFNMFSNYEAFSKFLKETFKKIQEQKPKALVIDIRKNPGGNSGLGDEFLKYLTDKPFNQCEKVDIKVSKQLIKQQGWIMKMYPKKEIGSIISMKIKAKKHKHKDLKYDGKIFVLIGPKTGSSAVMFASTIKHYKIGKLIGSETIDTPVSYGDCVMGVLPHTKLSFSVACKRFVDAGGEENGQGVVPDYEVVQRGKDTAKDIDTVEQFVFDLVKK